MDLTLKQCLDMVAGSVGMLPPSSWTNSNNQANRQMVYIANEAVLSLREKKFQSQRLQWTFTLSAESTRYAPPDDYLQFEPDTMWAQSSIWQVNMPTDPTVWAYLKASAGPSGVVIQARYLTNAVEIYQPIDGLQMGVEYISKYCVIPARSSEVLDIPSYAALFANDEDTHLFDDALLIAEIKWRYKKAKGLDDWPADMELAKQQLNSVRGRESNAKVITPMESLDAFCGPQTTLWVYPFE